MYWGRKGACGLCTASMKLALAASIRRLRACSGFMPWPPCHRVLPETCSARPAACGTFPRLPLWPPLAAEVASGLVPPAALAGSYWLPPLPSVSEPRVLADGLPPSACEVGGEGGGGTNPPTPP